MPNSASLDHLQPLIVLSLAVTMGLAHLRRTEDHILLKSAVLKFFPFRLRPSREPGVIARAFRFLGLLSAFLLVIPPYPQLAFAQSNAPNSVVKAYIDKRGNVHIVDSDGKVIKPPKEKGQVSCDSVSVAANKETVGWLAQFPTAALPIHRTDSGHLEIRENHPSAGRRDADCQLAFPRRGKASSFLHQHRSR